MNIKPIRVELRYKIRCTFNYGAPCRLSTARNAKHYWTTTDMECIELLNYLIEETKNVESPMNVLRMAREFKEKSGAAQTVKVLKDRFAMETVSFRMGLFFRIYKLRSYICNFDHIDTNTKVKLMFALSAPVNARFLEE